MVGQGLDLNLLKVFCSVVETGSMSEAAKNLNMNQSGVSSAMQKLKDSLGAELFIRQSRGVKPTAVAMSLYRDVSVDLTKINRTVAGITAFDPMSSKRQFTISCPEFSNTVLFNQLNDLANPDLKIVFHDHPSSSESLMQQLLDRERDLFIDVTVPDHPSIMAQPLGFDRSCVIASNNHPRLQGETISLEQFLTEPYVKLNRTRDQLAGIRWLTKAQIHRLNIVSYTQSLFESMVTVSQTELISTLPISMAEHFKNILGLKTFDLPFSSSPIQIYLLWHKAMDDDQGHRWLRERIQLIYRC